MMERKITNWKFWVFLLTLNFGVNAQNIITTTQTSTNNACDGTATVNPNMIGASTWNWQQDSVNVLQVGGTTISNLCPGPYFLTFVDSLSNTIYVNFNIVGPNPCSNTTLSGSISSGPSTDSVNCNGNIVLNVSGGVSPYQFQLNGIVYTNSVISNLCSGTYVCTVVDNQGCSIMLTGVVGGSGGNSNPCTNSTLTGTISATANTSSDPSNCNGTVVVNAGGGALPYTYTQANGVVSSDPVLANLCPGIYPITVTDSIGCSITLTGVVTGDSTIVTNPCANTMMFAQINVINTSAAGVCDGSISAFATGGVTPYTYTWNNGATINTLTNVCSDVYTVMVSDNNGCVVSATGYVGYAFDSTIVTMNLNGYVIPTGTSADGVCDGTASVIVYGGVAPYSFLFSDGSNSSTTANLCGGFQSVTVTDANGNILTLDFIVPSPINVSTTGNFNDSTLVDSVYNTAITDCIIDYSLIDSAFITNFNILPNDTVMVTWNVVYGDTVVTIIDLYGLGIGTSAGVYMIVLQIYCPDKSVGNYLTAYDQIYYNAAYAGINDQTKNDFNVSPNPVNDHIVITLNDTQDSEVIITDMTGKEVFNNSFNSEMINVDLSALSAGQYIMTVNNGTSIMNRKIVK